MVKGAKSGPDGSKAKAQYYPLFKHDIIKLYNNGRPRYDIHNLPMRTEEEYWETITQLANAKTSQERGNITRQTGVSRLPLAAASKALLPYKCYPIDPFHLFYENCAPHIWDLWVSDKNLPEKIFFKNADQLGKLVEEARFTLPPAFCGPIRDIYAKRQSQYKIYEWMALVHWYIVPMGRELGMNWLVLQNFALFSRIVEFAMTPVPRTVNDITGLQDMVNKFLEEFETIYLNDKPSNISRLRLCIFQLVHVPSHIKWHGSIRVGSQATVERSIGELGGQIRSKKSPFENLANIIFYREVTKILHLEYPELLESPVKRNTSRTRQRHNVFGRLAVQNEIEMVMMSIAPFTTNHLKPEILPYKWGKFRLENGRFLHSMLSESKQASHRRSSCWFEAMPEKGSNQPVFGKAIAFYQTNVPSMEDLVLYLPLVSLRQYLPGFWVGSWSDEMKIMAVSKLLDLIGIWSMVGPDGSTSNDIYPLRKHPGLAMLTAEESAKEVEEGSDDSDED
ncbi:hypothetical protein AGABI1DRAFT_40729 [Agaricus bisporus var. burnettii JB137-S8]|uniref:Uncharacterized protein n=1 Tax=Agaricus bisporus var. burnettii (strain JB137-S8 / ATCC MYA-4627 / FGSC 10392) TaxID=597362 RepID=K5WUT0_AGABU|nr:uncharacterized protein AGABI1DRAFT_40729 [Agaricus bisporus var. burnettii JB137-S8]EKM79206.1 hypothetical protein AGABI1DRAFT_40729 [Agaricus bisporus var. burnettii JB137-S8]